MERAFDAYNSGKISGELYDAIVMNAEYIIFGARFENVNA